MSNLAKEGFLAVKWNTITTVLRFGLQLFAQVILARYLGPENYGVFGIGMVVLTFSTFLANFGLGQSLLHKSEVTDEDIRFAFTWQVVAGLLATAGVWLSAPYVASFFDEPRAEPVIQWLSLTCILSAASSPAGNLVQRNLRFKALGLAQLLSYVVGYLFVGVPMALFGFGYEALVAAWLTQTAGVAIASYALNPHPIKPLFRYAQAGSTTSLSGIVFCTNVVNWVLGNMDRIAVGRILDTRSLGIYTASYNLATMPNSLLLSSLQPTLMALGSRLQGDHDKLRKGYKQILSVVWVVIFPAFAMLAAAAEDIVSILYGDKWRDVAPVLGLTFLAMPALISTGLSTPILWGSGKRHLEAILQAPIIFAALAGYTAFAIYGGGTVQLAAGISISVIFLRMLIIYTATARSVSLSWVSILPILTRGSVFGVLAYGAYTATSVLTTGWHHVAAASIGAAFAFLVCGLIVLAKPATLGTDTLDMLQRMSPRLADKLRLKA